MKKTGLEIVKMIAKDEQPNKIKWASHTWEYKKNNHTYSNGVDLNLLDLLNEEFEIIEEPKVWKPKNNEKYWYINDYGKLDFSLWVDDDNDKFRYEIGNCFKTVEEAEKVLEKIKIYVKLKRYAEEHNTEKIDWNNKRQPKYFISYDFDDKTFKIIDTSDIKDIGIIYFTEWLLCEQAIKEIGEDNIKKLFED